MHAQGVRRPVHKRPLNRELELVRRIGRDLPINAVRRNLPVPQMRPQQGKISRRKLRLTHRLVPQQHTVTFDRDRELSGLPAEQSPGAYAELERDFEDFREVGRAFRAASTSCSGPYSFSFQIASVMR